MNPRITVAIANRTDCETLGAMLRPTDLTFSEIARQPPADVLRLCFDRSAIRKSGFVDGAIAAMWGCADRGCGIGEPWLFSTTSIELLPVAVAMIVRREIAAMWERFPVLAGMVINGDNRAMRFARFIGATLGEPAYGGLFRRYRSAA